MKAVAAECDSVKLRRHREISASTWRFAGTGLDGVIPLGMEGVAFDVEGRHFGVADSDALFIGIGAELHCRRRSKLAALALAGSTRVSVLTRIACVDSLGSQLSRDLEGEVKLAVRQATVCADDG